MVKIKTVATIIVPFVVTGILCVTIFGLVNHTSLSDYDHELTNITGPTVIRAMYRIVANS